MDQRDDQRLDPRSRPQEDVEVGRQRGDADGTVRAVRHRRRALLVALGPSRSRHRVQRGADEGRAPPRHQAAQRHQVRARHRRRPESGRTSSSPNPSTRRCSPASTASSPRRPRRTTGSTTPGRWSAPRSSSGGSATTTSSWSRAAPTAAAATPPRHRRATRCARPRRPCSDCSPRRSRSPPRRRGVGGTTGSIHTAAWPVVVACDAPALSLDPISEVLARVRRVKTEAKVSQRAAVATTRPRRSGGLARRRSKPHHDDLTEALSVTNLTLREADDVTIAAALA